MEYKSKFCAFIDLLGTKKQSKDFDNMVKKYSYFMSLFNYGIDEIDVVKKMISNQMSQLDKEKIMRSNSEQEFFIFSDSIVIFSSDGFDLVTKIANASSETLGRKMLFRGGIGYGKTYIESSPNKNMIVSEALNEAVEIEHREAIYPRIVLSDSAMRELISQNENDVFKLGRVLIQDGQDSKWFVNPFYLCFDLTEYAQYISDMVSVSCKEVYYNKYLWMGDLINLFCNDFSGENYFENYKEKDDCFIDMKNKYLSDNEKWENHVFFYQQKLSSIGTYKISREIYESSFDENKAKVDFSKSGSRYEVTKN